MYVNHVFLKYSIKPPHSTMRRYANTALKSSNSSQLERRNANTALKNLLTLPSQKGGQLQEAASFLDCKQNNIKQETTTYTIHKRLHIFPDFTCFLFQEMQVYAVIILQALSSSFYKCTKQNGIKVLNSPINPHISFVILHYNTKQLVAVFVSVWSSQEILERVNYYLYQKNHQQQHKNTTRKWENKSNLRKVPVSQTCLVLHPYTSHGT